MEETRREKWILRILGKSRILRILRIEGKGIEKNIKN